MVLNESIAFQDLSCGGMDLGAVKRIGRVVQSWRWVTIWVMFIEVRCGPSEVKTELRQ